MRAVYHSNGDTVTFKATKEVNLGDIVKVGTALAGIATADIPSKGEGIVAITGAFTVPKVDGKAVKQGDVVYFKEADKAVTTDAADAVKLGVALTAASAKDTTVVVKLGQ